MKKFPLLLCCLFALQLNAQFLVNNQNFETLDSTTATGLAHWKSNKFYPTTTDFTEHHSGQSSLRMESVDGKTFGAFMQLVPIPKSETHRKITISGFLKRQNVEGSTGFWINVFSDKNSIGFDNMYQQQLKGTHDWQEVSTSVIVNETATDINIGGLISGKGTVWFDDLSITMEALTTAELPDSLRTYLAEALDILEKNALYRDSVAWPKLRENTMMAASGAQSYEACYPALRNAIQALGDHHSFFMPADASKKWENASAEPEESPETTGKMLENGIAYLSMPGFSSGDEKANTRFANHLHDLLERLDREKPTAWVLDLRQNTGGNCWPMLAGIGPLLGEGVCGYFNAPGSAPSGWFYKKGASGLDKQKITKVSRKPYKLKQKIAKVAVLTGPQTASSGEVVVVAFRNRPNCRSFGEPTYGVSTGNANFSLRDGAQIFLCSSVYADRAKMAYGSRITPDEIVPAGENDPVLKAATAWLTHEK